MSAVLRAVGALELARESARGGPCGCGARTGYSCDGRGGLHFVWFADVHECGLLGEERWAAVLAAAGDAPALETIVARAAHNPGVSG